MLTTIFPFQSISRKSENHENEKVSESHGSFVAKKSKVKWFAACRQLFNLAVPCSLAEKKQKSTNMDILNARVNIT